MRGWARLLQPLAGLLLAVQPLAAQEQGQSSGFSHARVEALNAGEQRELRLPDYAGGLLKAATLAERKRSEGGILGVLSLQSCADCWVSVLYYSGTGPAYRLLEALPLPTRQQTTLTFPLPPGDHGATRLLLWRERPTGRQLQVAERDSALAEALAGAVDERWFARSEPSPGAPVWNEQPWPDNPPDFMLRRTPFARAVLGSDGTTQTRNASVQFRGMTSFSQDSWGSYGQWQLGGGSKLLFQAELPPRRDLSRAVLRLRGTLDSSFSPPRPPQLTLEINGWRAQERVLASGGGLELVSFDVSPNVEYGLNSFAIGLDSFGADWLLRSIELWVE